MVEPFVPMSMGDAFDFVSSFKEHQRISEFGRIINSLIGQAKRGTKEKNIDLIVINLENILREKKEIYPLMAKNSNISSYEFCVIKEYCRRQGIKFSRSLSDAGKEVFVLERIHHKAD